MLRKNLERIIFQLLGFWPSQNDTNKGCQLPVPKNAGVTTEVRRAGDSEN